MNKIIATVCLAALLLCGCGGRSELLKPYTVVTAGTTSDISSMLHTEVWQGFASDLGVVSTQDSDAGVNVDGINGTEILLTGTTDHSVISAYNIYKQMPPASITKILTALVALKYGGDLDQQMTMSM
jgi:D-alanyl-D-alanine carboxypeptidase